MGKYRDKELKVSFSPKAFLFYKNIQKEVEEERARGKNSSFSQQLIKAVEREKDNLKTDPETGIHIPKKLIPKMYIDFYEINNLWKINLPSFYRMIYTIDTSAKIVINSIIIAIIDHEKYNKIFGYRKK